MNVNTNIHPVRDWAKERLLWLAQGKKVGIDMKRLPPEIINEIIKNGIGQANITGKLFSGENAVSNLIGELKTQAGTKGVYAPHNTLFKPGYNIQEYVDRPIRAQVSGIKEKFMSLGIKGSTYRDNFLHFLGHKQLPEDELVLYHYSMLESDSFKKTGGFNHSAIEIYFTAVPVVVGKEKSGIAYIEIEVDGKKKRFKFVEDFMFYLDHRLHKDLQNEFEKKVGPIFSQGKAETFLEGIKKLPMYVDVPEKDKAVEAINQERIDKKLRNDEIIVKIRPSKSAPKTSFVIVYFDGKDNLEIQASIEKVGINIGGTAHKISTAAELSHYLNNDFKKKIIIVKNEVKSHKVEELTENISRKLKVDSPILNTPTYRGDDGKIQFLDDFFTKTVKKKIATVSAESNEVIKLLTAPYQNDAKMQPIGFKFGFRKSQGNPKGCIVVFHYSNQDEKYKKTGKFELGAKYNEEKIELKTDEDGYWYIEKIVRDTTLKFYHADALIKYFEEDFVYDVCKGNVNLPERN